MRLRTSTLPGIRGNKSLVVFPGVCLSMLIGMAFQSFLASRLGTGVEADAFYLGTAVPTLVATALLGSAANALIRFAIETPTLLSLRRRGSVSLRLALLSLCFSAGMAVAGLALRADALPVSTASVRHRAGEFLLLTTPVPPLALLAAMGAVLALSRRQFVLGTYGGAVNGVGLLAGAVALSPGGLGTHDLAVAVDCGYLLQLAFVLPAFRYSRTPPVSSPLGDGLVRKAAGAFLLLAGASAIYKSQPLIERGAGALLGAGVPAALGYADKITSGLMQLAVFGFALAALPSLSQDLVARDSRRAALRLQSALTATFTSAAAVVAFGLVSATDLVRVLYERGAFGAHSAAVTRTLILCALPSVAFGAVSAPLVSLCYAAGRVRQVVIVGLGGFVAGTSAIAVLAFAIGYRGIVLGTGVEYALTFLVFARWVGTILREWSWQAFLAAYGPVMLAVIGVAAAASLLGRELLTIGSSGLLVNLVLFGVRFAMVLLACFAALVLLTRYRPASQVVVQP